VLKRGLHEKWTLSKKDIVLCQHAPEVQKALLEVTSGVISYYRTWRLRKAIRFSGRREERESPRDDEQTMTIMNDSLTHDGQLEWAGLHEKWTLSKKDIVLCQQHAPEVEKALLEVTSGVIINTNALGGSERQLDSPVVGKRVCSRRRADDDNHE
jgi:hypothetical protein